MNFKSCTQRALINSSSIVWSSDPDEILWAPALGLILVNIFITSLNNGLKLVIMRLVHKMKEIGNTLVERIKIPNVLDKLEEWENSLDFWKDLCMLMKIRKKTLIAKKEWE